MVIEVVTEETLSDSEGQRASTGTAHITVQSAKPAIEAAAPTRYVCIIDLYTHRLNACLNAYQITSHPR